MSGESIRERLQYYMRTHGIREKEMTEKSGLSVGVLNKFFNGHTENLGVEKIEKILLAYPELNADYLFRGQGAMLPEHMNTKAEDLSYSSLVKKYNELYEKYVVLYDKYVQVLEARNLQLEKG